MLAAGIAIVLISLSINAHAGNNSLHAKKALDSEIQKLKKNQQSVRNEILLIDRNAVIKNKMINKLSKDYLVKSIKLGKISTKNSETLDILAKYIGKNIYHQTSTTNKYQVWQISQFLNVFEKNQQQQINIEFEQKATQEKVENLKSALASDKLKKSEKLAKLEKQKKLLQITMNKINQLEKLRETPKPSGSSFSQSKTKFAPPILGKLVTPFGQQLYSSEFKTQHVEISPKESSVRAVNSGNVVLSKHVNGFGHMVVIAHPGDFFSVYAHCDSVLVSENSHVRKQEKIAELKYTEKDKTLYFALRHKQNAINPQKYIKL